MVADASNADLDSLVARLAAADDAGERTRILEQALTRVFDPQALRKVAERLKDEADRARYRDHALSLRWSDDVVALGTLAGDPTVVALGRMAEGLTLYEQGRHRDSLACFDEASVLFHAQGDEVGWARTQIGRTGTCMALARFDEALTRAEEARAILERAGERLRVASVDNNLALLLERMNRPAEALVYSERALAVYREDGSRYYAMHTLGNHALLLWRLGRVREALQAHQEARQGYVVLGAAADAAREDANVGIAYLALGRYAEAVSTLTAGRRDLLAAGAPDRAAWASLHLVECFVRLGRFREAVETAVAAREEFVRYESTLYIAQTLVWQALAHAGLHEHEAALRALDAASSLLAPYEGLASHRATLDVSRAQLLLQGGRAAEARVLLAEAAPALREAGLAVEAATAQVLWGGALLDEGRSDEARAAAGETLAVAEREGLDWLAARALHLWGRVEMRRGAAEGAREALAAAMRRLDRVRARVAWDDSAAFGAATTAVYADAMALALQQRRPAVALRYAERAKARALADHLRARIDVRPRSRDERSRALVDALTALRERYAWLGSAHARGSGGREASVAAVRWAVGPAHDAETRGEAAQIERRMAEIWRELQASNPAYRGEAAALDLAGGEEDEASDEDGAAQRWAGRVQAALGLGDAAALLEYSALGDDLMLFVLRAGDVRAVRLDGANAELRRLVPLLRLNAERSAAAVASDAGATPSALGANARGVLGRLHDALLAPAVPLLDGVTRLVVVRHGASHHVPFQALHDGRGYLVERLEVAYAPCAGLLEHFDERHRMLRQAPDARGQEALVLACSGGGALAHVSAEGAAVVAALGGRLLCEEEATLGALRALAGDCSVLHVAAHGLFRPDEPLFSALQLSDGRLSTLDVFDLELSCSLATLSACETALGTAGAGDELMGLSRAFLYAGAPSLVLSLWKVEDRSTAALMDVFYRALRRGESKAAALRRAQLALLHNEVGDGADRSAPFFWAPFQLIGHAGAL